MDDNEKKRQVEDVVHLVEVVEEKKFPGSVTIIPGVTSWAHHDDGRTEISEAAIQGGIGELSRTAAHELGHHEQHQDPAWDRNLGRYRVDPDAKRAVEVDAERRAAQTKTLIKKALTGGKIII